MWWKRWFSKRALLLHLAVLVVAPGCGLAGWWQATRALAGNTLSWFYSVEWPIFALIAVAAWWHLVHEAPEEVAARKLARAEDEALARAERQAGPSVRASSGRQEAYSPATAKFSAILAALAACEFVLGILTAVVVPFNRPARLLPATGRAFYAAHALFGIVLATAAVALVARTAGAPRATKAAAWAGFTGIALAGGGGLLTYLPSFARFSGMALMFAGFVVALFAYTLPLLTASSSNASQEVSPTPST